LLFWAAGYRQRRYMAKFKREVQMKKIIIISFGLFFFSGCAAHINELMNSWMNYHYADLIASWGPPQQVFDDGYGGRILIYETNRSWTVPGKSQTYTTGNATIYDNYIWGSARSYTTYRNPQTYGYTAYRMFWINKNGTIYRWAWRGL